MPSNYVSHLLADGCSQLWLLDDASGPAASNSVGGGMSAAYGGSVALSSPGILPGHNSTHFTSGYILTSGDPLTTPFHYTWSALLRVNGNPVACTYWDYNSGSNGNTEFSLMATQADGTLNLAQTHAANAYDQLFSWPSVGGGSWHQVVGSWDGSNIKVYLDGALAGVAAASTFYRTGAITLSVGGMQPRGANSNTRIDGYMSAVAVWTSAIADSVIADQYTTLAAEATGPVGQPATSGQVSAIISQLAVMQLEVDDIRAAVYRTFANS